MPQSPFRHSTLDSRSFNLLITCSLWDMGIYLVPGRFPEKLGMTSISASPSLDGNLEHKLLDQHEERYHLVY